MMHPTIALLSTSTTETIRYVAALLIPLLAGVLTKTTASSGLKSVTNTVLVALDTAITTLLAARGAHADLIVRQFIQTAVFSYATYYGLWKPTGVAGTVSAKTAGIGFDSPPVLETADVGAQDQDQGAVTNETPPPVGKTPAKKAVAKKATKHT